MIWSTVGLPVTLARFSALASRERFWSYEKAPKSLKILSKGAFWAFGGASGDPEIRTTATFPEWKNYIFLHLATIFDGKSAWDTVEYEVSTFAKTPKPSILRMKMNLFLRVHRPNEGKSWIFMKNHMLSFEISVFEASKLEFWAP